ncbi:MAG: hypothetical protein HY800_03605 [Ignavibacteriales bacterium]|nr:hypothetical protein [Ignavibacteriales bacterium]
MKFLRLITTILLISVNPKLLAQEEATSIITGQVTDAETGNSLSMK